MTGLFDSAVFGTPIALAALDVALTSTALLVLAFGIHSALGRRRALARSALWNACLVGLLLLPAASAAFPRLRLAILPARAEEPVPVQARTLLVDDAPSPTFYPDVKLPVPQRAEASRIVVPFEPLANAVPTRAFAVSVPQPHPKMQLSAFDIALGLYIVIAALLLLRLAVSLAAVACLRRKCEVVDDPHWLGALERWRAQLGIRKHVRLLATQRASVPVVVGWLRPAIMLPKALTPRDRPGLIDAVLVHELAHVRRGDFGWNVAARIVRAIYWPHPLVWLTGRVVCAVREQACDDLCVHILGGAGIYRATLLEVAAGLVRRPGPALGLAMARTKNLDRRIAWIDRSRGASRCLAHWSSRLAIVLVVAGLAVVLGSVELARAKAKAADEPAKPAEKPAAKADTKSPPGQPDAIEVTVRAKDSGKALPDARVRASIDMAKRLFKTGRDGRVRIDLSKRMLRDSLNIDVWAEGYIQQRHFFAQNDARYAKIPAQVTIDLLPAEETLGGTVTDEQGKPIAGVNVDIWGYLGEKKVKEELAYMVDATTDENGHWRCRCFRGMTFAYLYLAHPDFVGDNSRHPRPHGRPTPKDPPQADERPMEALRDFSDTQVMTRGVEVAGEVRDQDGKPVAGAEVGWIEEKYHETFHQHMSTTTTDDMGHFRFGHVRPGRLVLQTKAKGHGPELTNVDATEGADKVAIKLGPARTLAGRVVDSHGKPVPDAFVVIDTWRAYRALGVYLKSDAEGRFRWEDAPAESVMINASRVGYEGVIQRSVAHDETIVLTLNSSLQVSGWIHDAKTKKRIYDATVELGTADPKTGAVTAWRRASRVFATQGRFQAGVDIERTPEFRLRFQAKGYEPLESRTFRAEEGQVEYDVSLTPTDKPQGVAVEGIVQKPDGAPLAGAEVVVTYPLAGGLDRLPTVQIENGRLRPNKSLPATKTDAAGRFSLRREPDPKGQYFAVVVIHPDYFAEVSRPEFEADPKIVAKPWGRVEGVARIRGKLAAGASIRYFADRLGNRDVPHVSDDGESKADAEGKFVLERVVPGDVRVARGFGEPGSATAWSNGVLLEVKSGETAHAEVGGKGRPVVAKIALPPGFDPKGEYVANSEFDLMSDRRNIPFPKEVLAKRDQTMVNWGKRWWASAEGHEYRRKYFVHIQAKLQPDGTIRVDDVPPGEYRLTLRYNAEPFRGAYSTPERIAYATKQFTIPEIPGGRSDEPFDLGTLHPKPKQTLKVGQPAPAFEIETLDSKRVKLADFRGKYLLVDFWATWCGPCVAEIPDLKEVYDRFGKNERFAMLSLSLDADQDAPRKFVAEKNLPWTQGFLGEWAEGGVPDLYHVEAIPAMFLIAPDGTIKAQGLRGESVIGVVSQALEGL